MSKKLNSTEAFSKKLLGVKLSNSINRHETPGKKPASANKMMGLEEGLIAKNKKLSIMIRNVHNFITNVEQIEWILNELQMIMSSYVKKTLDKYGVSHQMQIQNLHDQLIKLIKRFTGMEKMNLRQMTLPIKMQNPLSENHNWLNLKKTETIGSFKYTDMDQIENQEDGPSDFSRIHLPTVVKQQTSLQNISNDQFEEQYQQQQIRQYDSTIKILNEQIERLKEEKQQIKNNSALKINRLNEELEKSMLDWHSYKSYAVSTIGKCKQLLGQITGNLSDRQQVDRLLNDLFSWQNKIDQAFIHYGLQQYDNQKSKRIREITQLQWKIKEKQMQLEKQQFYGTKSSSIPTEKSAQVNQSLSRMLYLQAATIQNLLEVS